MTDIVSPETTAYTALMELYEQGSIDNSVLQKLFVITDNAFNAGKKAALASYGLMPLPTKDGMCQ